MTLLFALRLPALALALFAAVPSAADSPRIVAAAATPGTHGWKFEIEIAHPDSGWDHFADGWEVLAPDGTRLGAQAITRPRDSKGPAAHALTGVLVPEGIDHVLIRARCSLDGWSGRAVRVDLPR